MAKRTTVALAALAGIALALTACSGGSPDPSDGGDGAIGDLKVGSYSVSTLDYSDNNTGYGSGLGNLIMEPLLVLDEGGQLAPWLAESWEQPEPNVYVYHLREGVTFSDGTPLTAEDVVFSYEHYREDGSANAYNLPATLDSIVATDDATVTVTLTEPNSAWEVVPARSQLGIFSKTFFEAHEGTFGQPGTGVVGTGPWTLTTFDPTSGAELAANPSYWGGEVDIAQVDWSFFSSETSAAIAFRAGEVDVYFPDDNKAFASTAGTELITVPSADTGQFVLNVLIAPWDDVHVRRAVALAMNKPELAEAWGGFVTPVDYFLAPSLLEQLGSPEEVEAALADVPSNAFDLDAAKAEMAQSAYPDGVDVTIAVAENGDSYRNVSQAIVAQLAEIGIRAEMKSETSEENIGIALGPDREAILAQYATYGAVSADPGDAFNYAIGSANATEGNWNGTNWSNAETDELIAQGFAVSDPAERLAIYAQLNAQFAENVPSVPLFQLDETLALAPDLQWSAFDARWTSRGPWPLELAAKG